jgi:uncharacterized protein (DUF58 family)
MTAPRSRTRLTRRGQIATGLFVANLLTGRILGLTVLTVLGVFGVLWIATQLVLLAADRTKIAAKVTPPPESIEIGQRAHVRYELTADRRVGKVQLVETRSSSDTTTTADHIWIGALGTRPTSCATSVYADRTELVAITHARLWRSDPLGLVVRSWIIDPAIDWACLPASIPPTMAELDDVQAIVASLRRLDPPTDFVGVRQFADGDDSRRIDWRQTSRTDQLMVRELEQPPHHPHVVIDIDRPRWSDAQIGRLLGWIDAIETRWPEADVDVCARGAALARPALHHYLASNTLPSQSHEADPNPTNGELRLLITADDTHLERRR